MIRSIAIAAAALTLPATPLFAQAMTPATYVMKAGAGDTYEKDSSRLLLTSSKNPKLRRYATMMIGDHTKSTAEVKAAAMKSRLTPRPPMLDATGRANMAALRKVSGTARDTLYIDQQKTSHQAALELQQGYAADGTAAPLKMTAAKIVPVVQHHIEMLNAM